MGQTTDRFAEALKEYEIALYFLKQNDNKQAKKHLVRALRILDQLYADSKGLERAKVIHMYKKIANILNNID